MKKIYALFKTCLAILIVLAFSVGKVSAQARTIQGKVTSQDDGSALPGVSVVVKGSTNGTITDATGTYKLSVPGNDAVLVFSFVGFTAEEVTVGNRTTVDMALVADVKALSEVVVTGYTSERKRDVVAAVSQLSAKNTVAIPVSNVEQAIQGRVPGVTVMTSAQPGATSQVRIRGFGSFTSNAPLYVVDGVPTFNVQDINPNDIETTTVLKDAGAASIYGARAAAGVIVYTTRHGKYEPGKINVTYDMSYGVTMPGKGIGILNPEQTAYMTWQAFKNAGQTPSHPQYGSGVNPVLPDYINVGVQGSDGTWAPVGGVFEGDPRIALARQNYNVDFDKGPIVQVVRANKAGTDWYKEVTRVAPVQRHTLGLSGGNDRSHFYIGLGYYNQQGILLTNYLKRYTARINSEFKPVKNVRIGENFQVAYRDNPLIGDQQSENEINMAYRQNPIIPVYDEYGGYAGTQAPGLNNPSNPVATRQRAAGNRQFTTSLFGNIYAEVDVLKNLTLRSSIGGNLYNTYYDNFGYRTYENSENNASYSVFEGAGYGTSWVFTNTARYETSIGYHNFKALIGTEAIKDPASQRNINGVGLNPFSIDPNFRSISNTSSTGRQVGSFTVTPRTLQSYFARLDYNFHDKYYLSGTLRRDASSAFGANKRTGYFPAITGAWRISGENFMRENLPWVEDLKIRGGWGIMGNQNISATNQFTLYTGTPGTGYDVNGTNTSVVPGIVPQQFGNPNGQWEQNITSNIGLDGTFMNGTFDVIVDVWQKKTNQLLYAPELPATVGVPFGSYPTINVGSIENKGIDLQVIKRQRINDDLNIVIDANFSTYTNKITNVATGTNNFPAGGTRIGSFVRNEVGHPISAFYGYKVVGYFRDAQDVAESPTQDGAGPGRFKYEDVNNDGKIDANDRTFIGNPNPKFTYGLNLTVNYKNFSLEAFFYGKQGNDVVNFTKWFTDFYPSFAGGAVSDRVLNSWTPTNQNPSTPIFENVSNFSTNTQANSWYVEKGSYLRMRNLQLNYNLPNNLLSRFGVQKAKVYLQAVNLFTLTKYKGQDPEVASSVDTNFGIDIGNYPATRQYSIGVSLGF